MVSNTPLLALVIGFFSSLHCFSMCGSIITALTLSLPSDIRNDKQRMGLFILLYNSGRLFSYTVAGALVGGLGEMLLKPNTVGYGHLLLNLFGSLILVSTALYLANWLPSFANIEKIGLPIWRVLEPIGRRLIPIKTPFHAFLFGAIWGWLPCSLVYITLVWVVANGNAWQGGLTMLAFGIGTLPAMFSAGFFSGWLLQWVHLPKLRVAVAVFLLVIAGLNLGLIKMLNPS